MIFIIFYMQIILIKINSFVFIVSRKPSIEPWTRAAVLLELGVSCV